MPSPTGLDDRSLPLLHSVRNSEEPRLDLTRRYVRFRERHENGFVEFDFSIGDPTLSVELVMSQADYEAFCATHRVTYLSVAEARALDADQQKWRYGAPGISA